MKWHICQDADAAAQGSAACIARLAKEAVAERGRFLLALSGGETPTRMFMRLSQQEVPWSDTYMFQVDERVAPAGDADRNLTALQADLLTHIPLPASRMYLMPVVNEDLAAAARSYAEVLQRVCGAPPVFDLIHLGLGADGHTASLVPEDPVLHVRERDVAITRMYKNRRRMTLTYPLINRARQILWLVTGSQKAAVLARLRRGDTRIPASAIERKHAQVFADADAGGKPL
jgi:6-phosphogluconolactonase